jgi:hypothetical protein
MTAFVTDIWTSTNGVPSGSLPSRVPPILKKRSWADSRCG